MPESFNVRLLDLLATTANELVERLAADACAISRTIGDVLIMVTEHAPSGRSLQFGGGYLVSDYPQTREVLTSGVVRALTVADPHVDAQEASVLRELGFGALVMLPLELSGGPWGLVEVYREHVIAFTDTEIQLAQAIVAQAASRVP